MRFYWIACSVGMFATSALLVVVGAPWSWPWPALYGACCLISGLTRARQDRNEEFWRGYQAGSKHMLEAVQHLERGMEDTE